MILEEVNIKSSLSPLNIFALLAPLSLNKPFPFDILFSIKGAWDKLDETMILLLFFDPSISYNINVISM